MAKDNRAKMTAWAMEVGKPVRQRSARQETTKKKCGTLPLYMYRQELTIGDDVPDIPEHLETDEDEEPEDDVLEHDDDDLELYNSEET